MEFDSINEALIACVKACGGSKVVGSLIWPDVAPDQAQRKLLAALDDTRPEKLSPSQLVFVLRQAREKGYHLGLGYLLADLGYAPTNPIEPRDEASELMRQYIEAAAEMKRTAERMERAASRVGLKVAA